MNFFIPILKTRVTNSCFSGHEDSKFMQAFSRLLQAKQEESESAESAEKYMISNCFYFVNLIAVLSN